MSYEDTNCPCGDKKPSNTMLCDTCVSTYRNRPEMAGYQDDRQSLDGRRYDALILIALARGRKRDVMRLRYATHDRTPGKVNGNA